MVINIKKTRENAVIPAIATSGSGAMDLTAAKIEYINENEVIVYTGLAMQPENPNYMVRVAPRSSFTKYNWVLGNSPALIDSDYTGEIILRFRAIPVSWHDGEETTYGPKMIYDEFPYQEGDRVAQMWVEEVVPVRFNEVDELSKTERGDGGFGSTGK